MDSSLQDYFITYTGSLAIVVQRAVEQWARQNALSQVSEGFPFARATSHRWFEQA